MYVEDINSYDKMMMMMMMMIIIIIMMMMIMVLDGVDDMFVRI